MVVTVTIQRVCLPVFMIPLCVVLMCEGAKLKKKDFQVKPTFMRNNKDQLV